MSVCTVCMHLFIYTHLCDRIVFIACNGLTLSYTSRPPAKISPWIGKGLLLSGWSRPFSISQRRWRGFVLGFSASSMQATDGSMEKTRNPIWDKIWQSWHTYALYSIYMIYVYSCACSSAWWFLTKLSEVPAVMGLQVGWTWEISTGFDSMKKSIIPCLDLKSMEIRSEKNIEVCRIEFAVFFKNFLKFKGVAVRTFMSCIKVCT